MARDATHRISAFKPQQGKTMKFMTRHVAGIAALMINMVGTSPNGVPIDVSDPGIKLSLERAAPPGTTATWSSFTELPTTSGVVPVEEGNAVRFLTSAGEPIGVLEIVRTSPSVNNPTGLWPHDYRRCSSVQRSELENIVGVRIDSGEFPELEMWWSTHRELAISLQVVSDHGIFTVDSKVFAHQYKAVTSGNVYTINMIGKDTTTVEAMVSGFLQELRRHGPVLFRNTAPVTSARVLVRQAVYLSRAVYLMVERRSSSDAVVSVTLTSWTHPNPTPKVTRFERSLVPGRQIIQLELADVDPLATDFDVVISASGQFFDQVFVNANGFGEYTTNWIPFAGSSSRSIVVDLPKTFPRYSSEPAVTALNRNAVRFASVATAAREFHGLYADLNPKASLDLRWFNTLAIKVRADLTPSDRCFVKLELADGRQFAVEILPQRDWLRFDIPLARFHSRWSELGHLVKRIAVVVEHQTGNTIPFAVDLADLAVR